MRTQKRIDEDHIITPEYSDRGNKYLEFRCQKRMEYDFDRTLRTGLIDFEAPENFNYCPFCGDSLE